MRFLVRLIVVGVVLNSLIACNGGKNKTNIELIQNMMDQINVKSQDWDPDSKDFSTVKVPPEGTIARNRNPYRFEGDPIAAGEGLKNPLAGDRSPEVLLQGKKVYEIYCGICHGLGGKGDGNVAPKMALKPPSLLSDKIRDLKEYPDGRIYHVIVNGQGVMGAYGAQIGSLPENENDRWMVVNYVRSLQERDESRE